MTSPALRVDPLATRISLITPVTGAKTGVIDDISCSGNAAFNVAR